MSDTGHHGVPDIDEARLGKVLVRSVLIATPIAIAFLIGTMLLTTDESFWAAFGSAILPGVLVGVFGGGFVGMIIAGE